MKIVILAVIWAVGLPALSYAQNDSYEDYRQAQELRETARAAYAAGDLDEAADAFGRAVALRPDHFGLWRNLAVIEAERGNDGAAAKAFERVAALGVLLDEAARPYFDALPDSAAKQAAAREFERSARRMGNVGLLNVEIPADIKLVEDLAYDADRARLYLSSVVNQKICLWRDRKFTALFDLKAMGLGSPLGLSLDVERQRLWVAFANVAQTPEPDSQQRTGLLVLDALTGEHLNTFVPDDAPSHAINDVIHHPDGRAFAADGKAGVIFVVDGGAMAVLSDRPDIVSAQGLAIDGGGRVLYVADYSRGIHRIDLTNGDHAFLSPPDNRTLIGLDGLALYSGDLIASRNGAAPKGFITIELSNDGRAIDRVRWLAANHDSTADPALLTRIEGQIWAVGVSGWAQFGDRGKRLDNVAPVRARLISLKVDP